jgi:hypothetical protein
MTPGRTPAYPPVVAPKVMPVGDEHPFNIPRQGSR